MKKEQKKKYFKTEGLSDGGGGHCQCHLLNNNYNNNSDENNKITFHMNQCHNDKYKTIYYYSHSVSSFAELNKKKN